MYDNLIKCRNCKRWIKKGFVTKDRICHSCLNELRIKNAKSTDDR